MKKHNKRNRERESSTVLVFKRTLSFFPKLVFLLFIIGIIYGWFYIKNPLHFPIKTVIIEASYQHIDRATLQKIIAPYATGGFFTVDVNQLRQDVLSMPWVAGVSVRRIWPNRLLIQVDEQQAIAQWGDTALLNTDGQVFRPPKKTLPNHLPLLYGPDDQASNVLQHYEQMNAILAPLRLSITKLVLNARRAWRMKLDNGSQIILGRINVMKRLQRLVQIYPKIFAHQPTPKTIDLRYNNGLAVSWAK